MKHKFHSNGKLLLTGEYVVLEGATALAIPTRFGQSLEIESIDEPIIKWRSFDHQGNIWYREQFSIEQGDLIPLLLKSPSISERLLQIFGAVNELSPEFLNQSNGFSVSSKLKFPTNWGLGSSSTLINNIAQWTNTDPFYLLKKSFGGSGYDVAAAKMNTPFLYTKKIRPDIQKLDIDWGFRDNLFFIHLNIKQNSREAIDQYQLVKNRSIGVISEINEITMSITTCQSLDHFRVLIEHHEKIISKLLDRTPIKEVLFKDYSGSVKSLGAWGGDFVLVTAEKGDLGYFSDKGYTTIIPYIDMVK